TPSGKKVPGRRHAALHHRRRAGAQRTTQGHRRRDRERNRTFLPADRPDQAVRYLQHSGASCRSAGRFLQAAKENLGKKPAPQLTIGRGRRATATKQEAREVRRTKARKTKSLGAGQTGGRTPPKDSPTLNGPYAYGSTRTINRSGIRTAGSARKANTLGPGGSRLGRRHCLSLARYRSCALFAAHP